MAKKSLILTLASEIFSSSKIGDLAENGVSHFDFDELNTPRILVIRIYSDIRDVIGKL
jgi:hypothetical protein